MRSWFVSITVNFLLVEASASTEVHQRMFEELRCTSIFENEETSEICWYLANKPDAYSAVSSCVRKLAPFLEDAKHSKSIIRINAMTEQERIKMLD